MAKIDYEKYVQQATIIKERISLLDYFFKLETLGELRFDGKHGKEYFFGFHHQKTGSISIRDKDNVWYDHSKGEGGDIIKAVQLFEKKTFVEAINRLEGNADIVDGGYQTFFNQNGETEYNVVITKALNQVQHPALISYLWSRGLELKDVDGLAQELHWTNGTSNFFGLGFENKNGGFSVRSKLYKGNLNGGGISSFTIGEQPKSIKMFEGSMDLCSYKHLYNRESYYAILLNGTGNLSEKLCLNIDEKSKNKNIPVHLYFDNGIGGKKATEKAKHFITMAEDKSSLYANLNDVNDFLVKKMMRKS